MTARQFLILETLIAAVIFIAANLLLQPLLKSARVDFTENNLYTVETGTRALLKDLAEPVEVSLVYSQAAVQDFPTLRAYATRVRELLQTYENLSGGKLILSEIDPAPFSEDEDVALAAGITAIETPGKDPLYFGLIGRNAVDDQRIIPFLSPDREATVEYDITRLIARLDRPDPPVVGILTDLPGMAVRGGVGGYALLKDIAGSFRIENISPDFVELPENMDVLLLVHPPRLNAWQSWLIDQYLLRSGRAVFLVDPAAKTAISGGLFNQEVNGYRSDLGILSKTLGVSLSDEAVADIAFALEVPVEDEAGRVDVLNHPLFIAAPSDVMNSADIITADLSRTINFGAPGVIVSQQPSPGTTLTSLVSSSDSPSFIMADRASGNMSPQEVLQAYTSESSALDVAVRISGDLTSAFPLRPPPPTVDDPILAELAAAAAQNAKPHILKSETPAEVVVIADVDFIYDDFYIIPDNQLVTADNSAFVMNAIDALSGEGALAQLRSRAPSSRPMTRVEALREDAEEAYFAEQSGLQDRLLRSEERLNELLPREFGDAAFSGNPSSDLTAEEQAELATLRTDIIEIRERLRSIERDYRRDIDGLESRLRAVNIWLGPVIVLLGGALIWRRERRRVRGNR